MKIDYHIHTEFSADSSLKLEELIVKAINNGYDQIAITEHFDFLPSEVSHFGIPPFEKYYDRIQFLKQKYPQIEILFGLEMGEIHRIKNYAETVISTRDVDVIIGSIHILSNGRNISLPFDKPLSKDEIMDYYQENLNLVTSSNIHILGHLGIYKRYYKEYFNDDFAQEIRNQIFDVLIKRDIALEINYSPLRKPYNSILPEIQYIKDYINRGGKLLTIGSDSHSIKDFDDHYDEVIKLLQSHKINFISKKVGSGWENISF